MGTLEIVQLPVLTDNYLYLVHEPRENVTAAIDPALAEPVRQVLRQRGWRLTHILNTHHHSDHVDGNLDLKRETGCTIVGPRADRHRIPGIDVVVGDGDRYRFGAATAQVFDVPGHTHGHIAYWFAADHALFSGDTIFALGCGRLFEGTPQQMYASLHKLLALPDSTRIYCAHEYTAANAEFALAFEPGNPALQARAREVAALRRQGRPTVPTTLGAERAANPFLRVDSDEIRSALAMPSAPPVDVFAELRRRKDVF